MSAARTLPAPVATDRRTLLTGAALASVVAATAALPAGASENLDAELLRLRAEYDRTREVWKAYWPTHDAAEEVYFKLRRAQPDREDEDVRAASGYTAVDAVHVRLMCENGAVVDAMADVPARSLVGIIAKAEVSAQEDNMEPGLVASLVADLVAMGKHAA